jgi:hypothetical protein
MEKKYIHFYVLYIVWRDGENNEIATEVWFIPDMDASQADEMPSRPCEISVSEEWLRLQNEALDYLLEQADK